MYNIEELTIEKNTVPIYKRKMLMEMIPTIYLPMSFVIEKEFDLICYDYSGYRCIEEIAEELSLENVFYYLEEFFKSLIATEAYLIPMDEIKLSIENVFIDNNSRKLVLKFIPGEKGNIKESDKLKHFLQEFSEMDIHNTSKAYIKTIIRAIDESKSLPEIITLIANIKREIHLSGIGNLKYIDNTCSIA